jgi:hypothetical protein
MTLLSAYASLVVMTMTLLSVYTSLVVKTMTLLSVHTSIFHVLYLIDGMSVECSRYRAFYVVFQVSILFVGLNMVVVVC